MHEISDFRFQIALQIADLVTFAFEPGDPQSAINQSANQSAA